MTTADIPDARFRTVFHSHYESVARYCLRRLPRHDVDDAVSRVFGVAWRKVADMPPGDEALPWLYRIASYEVSTMRRSAQRRIALRSKLSGLGTPPQPAPDMQVVRRAEHDAVLAALETLSEADREVILLRSYEGLTSEQIGEVLQCSPEAARQRLSRALKKLRRAAGFPQSDAPTEAGPAFRGGDGS